MSTPTVINEEYDIVIAGGKTSSTSNLLICLPLVKCMDVYYDRRHGCVCRCKSSGCETGTRSSDVPHNMIYPLKDTRPNLHVLTGVHVKHITFNEWA